MTSSATAARPSATSASEAFAAEHRVATWQQTRPTLPTDRWVRRSPNLYEHEGSDDQLFMVDVGESADGWQVSGVWVCHPVS